MIVLIPLMLFGLAVAGNPGYDVRADIDLSGSVSLADLTAVSGQNTWSLGRGNLSRDPSATDGVGNRFGWAGVIWGPVGDKYHVRHRVLDPARGRWLTRDPAGYVDGPNLYLAMGARPIIATDPMGLVRYCLFNSCYGLDTLGSGSGNGAFVPQGAANAMALLPILEASSASSGRRTEMPPCGVRGKCSEEKSLEECWQCCYRNCTSAHPESLCRDWCDENKRPRGPVQPLPRPPGKRPGITPFSSLFMAPCIAILICTRPIRKVGRA